MKIVTKRRVNKAVEEIIDVVFDHADFDIDVNGYQDYDITPYIHISSRPAVAKLLYEILTDKKPHKHWKLINVAVRGQK